MLTITIKSPGVLTKTLEVREGTTLRTFLQDNDYSVTGKSFTLNGEEIMATDEILTDGILRISKDIEGAA